MRRRTFEDRKISGFISWQPGSIARKVVGEVRGHGSPPKTVHTFSDLTSVLSEGPANSQWFQLETKALQALAFGERLQRQALGSEFYSKGEWEIAEWENQPEEFGGAWNRNSHSRCARLKVQLRWGQKASELWMLDPEYVCISGSSAPFVLEPWLGSIWVWSVAEQRLVTVSKASGKRDWSDGLESSGSIWACSKRKAEVGWRAWRVPAAETSWELSGGIARENKTGQFRKENREKGPR